MRRFSSRRRTRSRTPADPAILFTLGAILIAAVYLVVDRSLLVQAGKQRRVAAVEAALAQQGLLRARATTDERRRTLVPGGDSLGLTADPALTSDALLAEIARASRVRLTGMSPGASRDEGGLVRTPVDVALEGSYGDIAGFLARVEAAPLLVAVDGVTLALADDSSHVDGRASLVVTTLPPGAEPR